VTRRIAAWIESAMPVPAIGMGKGGVDSVGRDPINLPDGQLVRVLLFPKRQSYGQPDFI
jgi:hypothetical protein